MKGCLDELITNPLLLDLHKSGVVFPQHLKERLLKAK